MSRPPEAFFEGSLFEVGIGDVVVCRYKGGGRVEAGCFLVDVFCLGVKDAFFEVYTEEEFREEFLPQIFPDGVPSPQPAAWGRKLIEEAVRYAGELGLSPHPDFKKGARVFGGIDARECSEEFVFGSKGKPFYIQGPHDSPEKAARIMNALHAKRGPGGFDYLLPIAEEGDGDDRTILALDSEADHGDPSPELAEFAEEFLVTHDHFRQVEYPGSERSDLPAGLLAFGRKLHSEMLAADGLPLSAAIEFIATLWNVRSLPPEDREAALKLFPEGIEIDAFKALLHRLDDEDAGAEHLILDTRILNEETPGYERLLMLIEPI